MTIPTLPILLLNHNTRNLQLLCEYLGKEGYQTLPVNSYEDFDQIIAARTPIAVALVDITGFDSQIWGYCENLRAWKIPFLVISPKLSTAVQQASLSHGARGVMIKPLVIKEFISIIQSLLNE